MSKELRDVYMNHKQWVIYNCNVRDGRLLGARRFGKTDGTIAPRVFRVTASMPRGTFIWLGNSRKQLYTRTVPGTLSAMERMFHLRPNIDFGFGKPPKRIASLPILKPKSWDNVLWFANGAYWSLISMAVVGSANSLTANSIIADECKFMSKAKIDDQVMPALSGQVDPLGNAGFSDSNPLFRSTFFASDAALSAKGNWLEQEEKKLDLHPDTGPLKDKTYREIQQELENHAERVIFYNELLRNAQRDGCAVLVKPKEQIDVIRTKAEMMMNHEGPFKILPNYGKRINKAMLNMCINYHLINADEAEALYCHKYLITPEQYFDIGMIKESKKYNEHIRLLQCNAFAFWRANTLDNLDIVSENYIARMARDLPPVVFAVSILNKKVTKTNDGFYSNLDLENIHGYVPDDCPAIDKSYVKKEALDTRDGSKEEFEAPDFGLLQDKHDCTLDGDVVDSLPLYIAMDYNANINWVVTGQVYKRDGKECLNVISSMYVKNERKLRELMTDWNHYYAPKRKVCNEVTYFFDATAKFRSYAVEGAEDFRTTVVSMLTDFGWSVRAIDMGTPMEHREKYKYINEALVGASWPAIRINTENNEALCIALQMAEVEVGYRGWHKCKAGEKLSEDADNAVRLEYRTDGTDAFDSLFIGVKFFLNNYAGMGALPLG